MEVTSYLSFFPLRLSTFPHSFLVEGTVPSQANGSTGLRGREEMRIVKKKKTLKIKSNFN